MPKINLSQQYIDEILQYYKLHSILDTAQHFNRSKSLIERVLRENNIPKHSINDINAFSIEKSKQTCLEKYGVEFAWQASAVKEKIKQSNLDKFGVEYPLQAVEVKAKSKKTCLDKYGVEYTGQADIKKQRTQDTCLEKYGSESFFASDIGKDKIKSTNLQRYGTENVFGSDIIQEKIKGTMLERYGVDYITYSPEFWNKVKATNLDRYGCECSFGSKEVQEKTKQTCLEKYGVPYNCMTPNCRLAYNSNSKPNLAFKQILIDNGLYISDKENREFSLENRSFDFKINNNLIEINPSATHNSTFGILGKNPMPYDYHQKKSILAKQYGYRCIHIWDWDNIDGIIGLLTSRDKVFARKCEIKDVSRDEAKQFINRFHIQGYANDSIRIGLYYNNELISIMTFGKPRYSKKYEYELVRYCSNKLVVGGASKIFNYFIQNYNPTSIVSYCDLSKFNGETYTKLNFTLKKGIIKPSKHWYNSKTKQHITDNLLRQRGFDQLFNTNYGKGTNNDELMVQSGFIEIYDCGQATYEWFKEREKNV